MKELKAGDIIGFSGRSGWSALINLCTGGIPLWSLSHVGIMAHSRDGRLLLWESTDDSDLECDVSKKKVAGVQAHEIGKLIDAYNGRMWVYRLYRPLFRHENQRLTEFLHNHIGKNYDECGAIRAGGYIFSLVQSLLHNEDFASFFCSELAAAPLSQLGIFPTINASRWSPNKLMRAMRRRGLVYSPERIK